ncbi:polyprenyl synthetase family protein [Streptomyces aidingensis]|uniref:Geranylgeranyl diphosphate synthase, type I n=1 Tax=Streptomyces aidingensis TaxID=910347 RepID=A0A1I1IYG7_9ACTN|nr:polyprenyl synthetase family protein [Streptomyces aidingensis]SFC40921.1 geranylgeranyl diphosphate synthase, type I [Streptomyces aidingensis]
MSIVTPTPTTRPAGPEETGPAPDPGEPGPGGPAAARRAVDTELAAFVDEKIHAAAPRLRPLLETVRGFLFSGGKRLRPLLCLSGWQAAGGHGASAPVLRAAASLELFHAFALVHDDLMDGSALRRGRPSLHRTLALRHRDHLAPGGAADPDRFGTGAALLAGDLLLSWSDELLHRAGLPADRLPGALALVDTMRNEVMQGQYLDLLVTGCPSAEPGRALEVARLKTAKYTVERPLHLGALLAGAGRPVLDACTAYALPVGEAFQLRDDLLGVFGDPAKTGKPATDDLRDGKATVLLALAFRLATPAQRGRLRQLVGRPDLGEREADTIRGMLTDTGARAEVERMIRDRYRAALQALHGAAFPPAVAEALRRIARAATTRPA